MSPSLLRRLFLLTAALLAGACVCAQTYPSRPIKLVVPFPPGGSTDILARLLSQSLGDKLKQPIVVDNKPGASTILGAESVAKASPDGYTLLLSAAGTYTVNPAVYKKLPYDPLASFDPLGIVGSTSLVLLANPAIKANSLKELVEEVRKIPGGASYGSFGTASTSHFAGEMITAATHMNLLHVPYKGSAPAMQDLMGNQISLSIDTVVAAAPQLKAGKVKAIAITGTVRSNLLPQVPTAAEAGYPAVSLSTWFAIVGPKGLPAAVRSTLEAAVAATMKEKALQDALIKSGYEPEYGTPDDYRARVPREIARLRTIAEAAKITAE
ncbi:MAG TPA: tripartite tricarboxylate transporter substrate binding protein [Polaromonas sp.]|jgi:tripartite-type tricarboxylate transporter receptor subunit TctC